MDYRKDLKNSLKLLSSHKHIIFPTVCSLLLPVVLIALFLNVTGVQSYMNEYSASAQDFKQIKGSESDGSLHYWLYYTFETGTYKTEEKRFLEKRGFDEESFHPFLTLGNLFYLIFFVTGGILLSFYFTCMNFAIISLGIKKKKIAPLAVFETTNRYLFRFFSLELLQGVLLVGPAAVVLILGFMTFAINLFLGYVFLFFSLVIVMIYILYFSYRLFYSVPAMYIDERGPVASLKASYQLTKGHIVQVLMVFLIIYSGSLICSRILSIPVNVSVENIFYFKNIIILVISLVVASVFILLEAMIITLQIIFFFYSYIDFKTINKASHSYGDHKN